MDMPNSQRLLTRANVDFFRGTEIADPAGLLEGPGRFMRHVKLGPGREVDALALEALVQRKCLYGHANAAGGRLRQAQPERWSGERSFLKSGVLNGEIHHEDVNMKDSEASGGEGGQSASELITQKITGLADWRGKTLGRMRALIQEADPEVVEE